MIIATMIWADRKSVMTAVITGFWHGKEGGIGECFSTFDGQRIIAYRHKCGGAYDGQTSAMDNRADRKRCRDAFIRRSAEIFSSHDMKRSFFVRAIWDDEAKVFYSESDIHKLHIEAPTMDVFEEVVMDVAADMIAANHRPSPNRKEIEYAGFH